MKIKTATVRRLRDALLLSGRRQSEVVSSAHDTLARLGMLEEDEKSAVAKVQPLAETMYLMMSADGVLSPEEKDAVRGAIRGLSDNAIHDGTIEVMFEQCEERAMAEGRDARLEVVARALSPSAADAEGAFALAAAIALADDQVDPAEQAFIEQLAQWFGIAPERASRILDELEDDATGTAQLPPVG